MSTRKFDDVSEESATRVVPIPDGPAAFHDIALLEMDDFSPSGLQQNSIFAGLLGISAVGIILAVAFPVIMEMIEDSGLFQSGPPPFWIMMPLIMSMMLPALAVGSINIAACMFWHVSIVGRFVAALFVFVPGVMAFLVAMSVVEGSSPPSSFYGDCASVFTAMFAASAIIGVVLQLCTPWTLTHYRTAEAEIPRIGTRTLFELTTAIAISFAFARMVAFDVTFPVMALFCGMSAFGSVVGIYCIITFMRNETAPRRHYMISLLVASSVSLCLVTFWAYMEYGSMIAVINDWYIAIPVTLFGGLIICLSMAVCLRWLYLCGWRCVEKRPTQ